MAPVQGNAATWSPRSHLSVAAGDVASHYSLKEPVSNLSEKNKRWKEQKNENASFIQEVVQFCSAWKKD